MSRIRRNVRRKGKMEKICMFDGLFICQCVLTSILCVNTKIFLSTLYLYEK